MSVGDWIMIFLLIVIIIVIVGLVIYFFRKFPHFNPFGPFKPRVVPLGSGTKCPIDNSDGINYGDMVQIYNYFGYEITKEDIATQLSSCGDLKDCGKYGASLPITIYPNTNIWQIVDENGSALKKPVNYMDTIQLINQFGEKLSLSACGKAKGDGCGLDAIVGNNAGPSPLDQWVIEPSFLQIGIGGSGQTSARKSGQVMSCDAIGLRNSQNGILLAACGSDKDCGGNVTLMTKDPKKGQAAGQQWIIILAQ